ncbi:MAG TPA: outer membrane beta-barrel protein [Geomonas sp.]
MKKRLLAFLALATLATPTICSATPPRMGPYMSAFIGVAVPTNTDVTGFDVGAGDLNDRVEFDPGINIGATGGFDYGFVRLEGELSYKHGEINRVVEINGTRYTNIDGSVGALAVLGNIFLDLHNPSPVTPYLGGGVGFAAMHQSDTFGTSPSRNRAELYQSDDDTVFAYQAGVGLEIALSRMLSLDVGYRYFGTSKATFTGPDTENELKFESHNAAVGLRVKF